jgi:probable phosphoglycerate mutase
MTRFLFVRHGESEWNAEGRWQGWADPPLSLLGRLQATHAARALEPVDAVVSSDLRRAIETADLLGAALGVELVAVESDIRERNVGEWSGLTRDEINERWPDWRDRLWDPPGGETHDVFRGRIVAGLERLIERHADAATVLAVSHGGVIRMLERHLGLEPDPIPNLGGRWILADGAELSAGERVILVDPDDIELTIPPEH